MVSLRWLSAGLLLAAIQTKPANAAETLERALVLRAPQICKHFKDKGYQNVGVLDFLVIKDERSFRDNSSVRLFLAQQLEIALVLASNPRQPLGLIPSAAVRHRLPLALPYTRNGRRLLLSARYPLAWGESEVLADAFVTGTAFVSPDRRSLTLQLFAFDRTREGPSSVGEAWTVSLTPDRLATLGESFLHSAGNGEESKPEKEDQRLAQLLQQISQVHTEQNKNPAEDPAAPVTVAIRCDGQAVAVVVREGQAFVPELQEGQKLELVVKHQGSGERYGVVLKVNGENTLGRQRLPDLRCRRWLLEPNTTLTIRGFQNEDSSVTPFPVLTAQDIRERQILGRGEGHTITLTVFGERQGKGQAPDISDEAVAATAVAQAVLPAKRPSNFHALKAVLLEESNYNALLVKEEEAMAHDRRLRFRPERLPMMGLSITSTLR